MSPEPTRSRRGRPRLSELSRIDPEDVPITPPPQHGFLIDLAGKTFGFWKVIRYAAGKNSIHSAWLCECFCGKKAVVSGFLLRQGKSLSCGCRPSKPKRQVGRPPRLRKNPLPILCRNTRRRTGFSRTRLWQCWANMKRRCFESKCKTFKDYGGRGIRVCEEWKEDFLAFKAWAEAAGYREDLTIERRDNNGDYEPGNCCWVPGFKQAWNKRNSRYATAFGETKSLGEWAQDPRAKVSCNAIRMRLDLGWEPELAITIPKFRRLKN